MIKDLEPLLEEIYQSGNYEVESAIMQFGHGDCHELTWALNEKYGAKIIAIVAENSGIPIHSCVLINENLTLDSYGINTIENTLKRYNKLSLINFEEAAKIKYVDSDWICSLGGDLLGEKPEEIIEQFQPIVEFLNIDLETIFLIN